MQVFIANVYGQEEVNELAQSIGLNAGVINFGGRTDLPAVGGNTFNHKDILKSNGARWNCVSKVWTFETIEQRNAAIRACI